MPLLLLWSGSVTFSPPSPSGNATQHVRHAVGVKQPDTEGVTASGR